jgi:hypothetical protein
MQVLFLWLRKYGVYEKQGLSFSNEYIFDFHERATDYVELTVRRNPAYIKGFCGAQGITDISALIGKNGTGKTTILNYLKENLPEGQGMPNKGVLLAVRHAGKCAIWCHDDAKWSLHDESGAGFKLVQMENGDLLNDAFDHSRRATSVVYYSNSFDARDILSEESARMGGAHGLHDVSTNFLARHDRITFANNETYDGSEVLAHRFMNWQREVDFLASPHAGLLNFPLPAAVHVTIKRCEEQELAEDKNLHRFLQPFEPGRQQPPVQDLRQAFVEEVHRAIVFNFVKTAWRSAALSPTDLPVVQDNHPMRNRCVQFFGRLAGSSDPVAKAHRRTIAAALEFMRFLSEELAQVGDVRSADTLTIPIAGKSAENLVLFARKYASTIDITDYLLFHWSYPLSSGQQSMLNLYSRLWSLSDDPKQRKGTAERSDRLRDDVILLFDEADTYFHPEWQKQLLSRLLVLLPAIYPNRAVQLIFTANTPFLLSDLLDGQGIFLASDRPGKVVNATDAVRRTFCGNIHDLLANSFFMGNSLVGDFAKVQMEKVIKWLSWRRDDKRSGTREREPWLNDETIERIIAQIGDPLLRSKLKQMYIEAVGRDETTERLRKQLAELEAEAEVVRRELVAREQNRDQDTP